MTAVEDPTAAPTSTGHPLEPLTGEEVTAAVQVLRTARGLTETTRFVFVTLHEPPKAAVFDWSPGDAPLPREAHVVLYERGRRTTYEAVVSLTDETVLSFEAIEGVQAPMMAEEFESCEKIVQADPRWQEAMRLRGVEDFSLTMIDPWASSWTGRRTTRPCAGSRVR